MVKSVYGEKEILLTATEYGMMTSHGKGQVVMGLTAPLMHKDRASRVQQELVQTMTMIFLHLVPRMLNRYMHRQNN